MSKKANTKSAVVPSVKTLAEYLGDLPSDPKQYTSKEQLKALGLVHAQMKADGHPQVGELADLGYKALAHLKQTLAAPASTAKAKFTKTVEQLDRKTLAALAKEATKVMTIKPAIDAKGGTDEELQARLVTELADIRSEDVVKGDDAKKAVFSPEALAVIQRLGLAYPGAPKAKKAGKGGKGGLPKVGIISTIIELLTKKAMTKDEVLAALVKQFPDRSADGMKSTLNIQVPGRLTKDKGLKFTKNDKGAFKIA
jgi:hypothetical protein